MHLLQAVTFSSTIVCSFIDPKVFYEVVVPLLEARHHCFCYFYFYFPIHPQVKHTAMLAISTPLSQSNHYSELCNSIGKVAVLPYALNFYSHLHRTDYPFSELFASGLSVKPVSRYDMMRCSKTLNAQN